MKVTTKIYKANVQKVTDNMSQALTKSVDAMKTDLVTSQTMPFDTGSMQNRSMFIDDSEKKQGKVSLVVDTPYARKVYFHPEFNFKKVNNPSAGAKWFEIYITGSKKNFLLNAFKTFIKGKI